MASSPITRLTDTLRTATDAPASRSKPFHGGRLEGYTNSIRNSPLPGHRLRDVVGASYAGDNSSRYRGLAEPADPLGRVVRAGWRQRHHCPADGTRVVRGVGPARGGRQPPGAAGNVGSEVVAHAAPDGYTWLIVATPNAINESLYSHLGFSLERDFAPVALLMTMPNVLEVTNELPVHSVAELIAYANAHPGKLNYGSGGIGSTPHMAAELSMP